MLLRVDERGRVSLKSLGVPSEFFRATVEPNGNITLEPVVVVPENSVTK